MINSRMSSSRDTACAGTSDAVITRDSMSSGSACAGGITVDTAGAAVGDTVVVAAVEPTDTERDASSGGPFDDTAAFCDCIKRIA